MLLQVIPDQLSHYLRRRQVLCGAQLFERLLLVRVDENGKAGSLAFHKVSADFSRRMLIKL
ncbi:hypothetical protein FQZ97_658020 [compost metagenome]